MSMFENYKNLDKEYAPNNEKEQLPQCEKEYSDILPKELKNYWGEFIGYKWKQGDTFTLPVNLNDSITINEEDIVYLEHNEEPNEDTKGDFMQSIYNTYDIKRWTCFSVGQTKYIWKEIKPFTYPALAPKTIYLQTAKDISGKTVEFSIVDFRGEKIYTKEYEGAQIISVVVDKELSTLLRAGAYKSYFSVIDGTEQKTVKSFFLEVEGEEA